MQDVLGPGTTLGYCTNVHPGVSFADVKSNLERFAIPIKQRVSPDRPMAVGLWFSAQAMQESITSDLAPGFRDWLSEHGLVPYTFNGFPFADFHQPVVKDAVYLPHWGDDDRYQYTLGLAAILADLLPDGAEGSISTLPLGWPKSFGSSDPSAADTAKRQAADQLLRLVHTLARIELDTGHHLHLNLEPEPGCILETSAQVVRFFERYLLGGPDDLSVLAYLRVCHDICHTAVMFEDQAVALQNYRDAGIKVGKAQLSSALRVPFDEFDDDSRAVAHQALRSFCEDRYLHQTTVRTDDGRINGYVDLPDALADPAFAQQCHGEWRIHFHVPIHLASLGPLGTTQSDILDYLSARRPEDETRHFEVETYAWDVLPPDLRVSDLTQGIAEELQWIVRENPA
ncbi:MAG: metabolite traffic protein EboE [Planctomycetota bacterium]